MPRRRNAQRQNAVGIRRCVEIRYSDDCLGNEAIRFCKSGLNRLIILKVLSKIIKDKIWLKIWSVFQDWGGQPQKRGKRNWHMISYFAHTIEAVPYTWQCVLWSPDIFGAAVDHLRSTFTRPNGNGLLRRWKKCCMLQLEAPWWSLKLRRPCFSPLPMPLRTRMSWSLGVWSVHGFCWSSFRLMFTC